MALPPEPLEELIPQVAGLVVAEVVAVVSGEKVPLTSRPLPIGAAPPLPEQRVRLKVSQAVLGDARGELEVIKPQGAYVLAVGHHGPFLLDHRQPPRILGRYGPDTYSLPTLKKALEARRG
jgi:hypothetical protein